MINRRAENFLTSENWFSSRWTLLCQSNQRIIELEGIAGHPIRSPTDDPASFRQLVSNRQGRGELHPLESMHGLSRNTEKATPGSRKRSRLHGNLQDPWTLVLPRGMFTPAPFHQEYSSPLAFSCFPYLPGSLSFFDIPKKFYFYPYTWLE